MANFLRFCKPLNVPPKYIATSGQRIITLDPNGGLSLHHDNEFYISWGSRTNMDYNGKVVNSYDDCHHWEGTIKTTIDDFWFTID